MPLKSDLTIDASKFDRKLSDQQTEEFNEKLIKIWADGPRWYQVSIQFSVALSLLKPPHFSLGEIANRPRLARRNTVNSVGKEKHLSPNPSFSLKASIVPFRRGILVEKSPIASSNLVVGCRRVFTCTYMAEDGCYNPKLSRSIHALPRPTVTNTAWVLKVNTHVPNIVKIRT